ncbi:hypothetical protein NEPTK9_000725 [Candidatus Neptunochlamydia vexilliferae]|uniref:Uncharacterized protein n=1 Tax=Candidatus Neptunichlamydia vexilliferae TaxID=1651774 RepID=A0ABS0AYL3_9BACT|nr:hypothetical protein [Candidatus Neptunochlamydia vexilliferae]
MNSRQFTGEEKRKKLSCEGTALNRQVGKGCSEQSAASRRTCKIGMKKGLA